MLQTKRKWELEVVETALTVLFPSSSFYPASFVHKMMSSTTKVHGPLPAYLIFFLRPSLGLKRGGGGLKKGIDLLGNSWIFPNFWNYLKFRLRWEGAHLFRFEPFPDPPTHAWQIWSRSNGRLWKKGGTDRPTHKGTLQLYIVDDIAHTRLDLVNRACEREEEMRVMSLEGVRECAVILRPLLLHQI